MPCACICPRVTMVMLCMFARLEASEMEKEARVDQSGEHCRNFPLILFRPTVNRECACLSFVIQPAISTAQGGKKKSQTIRVIPGSVQINPSSQAELGT